MHKKIKKKKLAEEREIRKENTYNGRRRERYKSMANSGELGIRELKNYLDLRAYILNNTKKDERLSLPYDFPKQAHYDLARLVYRKINGSLIETSVSDSSLFS